jgi:hypothetical protein
MIGRGQACGKMRDDMGKQALRLAAAVGNSLYLVGKVLGHSQAATTQRYAHLKLDPVRAVADRTLHKLAEALLGVAAG